MPTAAYVGVSTADQNLRDSSQVSKQSLAERRRERIPRVLRDFERLGIVTVLDLADEPLRRVVVDSRYERQVTI